jgi:23S rRNA (adenine2503-C2)-methyltransferase
MGCRFCLTGETGLIRNLKAWEIVDQILNVNSLIMPKKITNIVFMGMGEPMANFDEVVEALKRIMSYFGISKRRITLSTAGLVPKILELPGKAPDVNLAISLNATTDAERDSIMPVNKKYPMRSLIEACKRFPLRPRRLLTIEYVLIAGVSDYETACGAFAAKVNLIPESQGTTCNSHGHRCSYFRRSVDNNMTAYSESRADILGGLVTAQGKYSWEQADADSQA